MRRLLTAVIAVLFTLAGATAAHADPGSGGELRCGGYRWLTPEIEADTCTHYYFWDYGRHWRHEAWVNVRNNSAAYWVNVQADLIVNGQVGYSVASGVAPRTEQTVMSNALYKAPDGTRVQGRGYFTERSWSTYTYAPQFP